MAFCPYKSSLSNSEGPVSIRGGGERLPCAAGPTALLGPARPALLGPARPALLGPVRPALLGPAHPALLGSTYTMPTLT